MNWAPLIQQLALAKRVKLATAKQALLVNALGQFEDEPVSFVAWASTARDMAMLTDEQCHELHGAALHNVQNHNWTDPGWAEPVVAVKRS